jgi:hypothetical protein
MDVHPLFFQSIHHQRTDAGFQRGAKRRNTRYLRGNLVGKVARGRFNRSAYSGFSVTNTMRMAKLPIDPLGEV